MHQAVLKAEVTFLRMSKNVSKVEVTFLKMLEKVGKIELNEIKKTVSMEMANLAYSAF